MDDGRLLVLDDDSAVGEMFQVIAATVGVSGQFVIDPMEFLSLVDSWQPTHIAIDLNMPTMDGVEVLMQLAKRKCKAAIIISSGLGERVLDAAARSAKEHGLSIAGVLPKPFTPNALRMLLMTSSAHGKVAAKSNALPGMAFVANASDVQQALEKQELEVFYQPKVECKSGALAGFEALCRWRHPDHGLIMPDRFISIAEANRLIGELTYQVLDQSLSFLSRNFGDSNLNIGPKQIARNPIPLHVAINMSPQVLRERDFVEHILAACTVAQVDPGRINLELTETSAMENPVDSLAMLTRLRVKGFQLSIDDFGTGYSSMVQLVQLPFSEIKIDRSFVMTASRSEESRSIVKSIVSLGHSLGLRATAEGVEDQETLEFLQQIGCDLVQGYLIARPMPEPDVLNWLRNQV